LSEILAGYLSNGLPTSDAAGDDDDDDDDGTQRHGASMFTLETSWTDVVHDHESLDKRQRDYEEAVWELLSTELDHISKLRVVVDVRITHTHTHTHTHSRFFVISALETVVVLFPQNSFWFSSLTLCTCMNAHRGHVEHLL